MDAGGITGADAGKARSGDTFVCVASGPSLAKWQCRYIRDKAVEVIATNTSFKAISPPAIVYGCDGIWWDRYAREVREAGFEGWTQDAEAAQKYGLKYVKAKSGRGLCHDPMQIFHGANSGYQAIGLAYVLGASRIILIGYDMQHTRGKTHWHGDHPKGLTNAHGINKWVRNFDALAVDLAAEGVGVVNCTVETALTCFPRADLRDVL